MRVPDNREPARPPKLFVLDTNVILHDNRCIFNFQDNDIYIPVSVIEELDKFKKGDDILGYNARAFVRVLDKISDNTLFDKGISLGKGRGLIKIEMGHGYTGQIRDSLIDDIPDHRIIATAVWLRDNNPGRKVILVTKDLNMRLKAKALGLMAQDYLSDKVEDKRVEKTEKEVLTVRNMKDSLIEDIVSADNGVSYANLGIRRKPACNQYYKIYDSNRRVTLARYDDASKCIIRVRPRNAFGIAPRNDEQILALDAVLNKNIKIIALTGRSGTGKTLLAIAGALEQAADYKQILLSRPVIPMRSPELGFIPGMAGDKSAPYMPALSDNLEVIRSCFPQDSNEAVRIDRMQRDGQLVINPLASIRCRSLVNVFLIVDDAQNLTPHEVKTIITRAGEGTKIVFTGDIYQIDQPYLDFNSNGLTHLCDKFFGQNVFAHINMIKGERSGLSELAGKLL
ncbi:MAG TPA: PhoH family protein [Candidatus Coprenecus stercoravium]|uniref:PhoH family protein n=1 Tax=Candidatus Coprenecus stercoravium TaxID=2840735 RepID=A0A9D2GQS2_9BACT|nr:PhoH family protein [Candidatus Coprenecus stercoravium]